VATIAAGAVRSDDGRVTMKDAWVAFGGAGTFSMVIGPTTLTAPVSTTISFAVSWITSGALFPAVVAFASGSGFTSFAASLDLETFSCARAFSRSLLAFSLSFARSLLAFSLALSRDSLALALSAFLVFS
jgi:hypothetical protein